MTHRSKQAAMEVIELKLKTAHQLMLDCAKLADHEGIVFHLPWGGEGTEWRGMGATYVPESASDDDKRWNLNEYSSCGWQPSAGTC